MVTVISLGGSIVAPKEVDVEFLKSFVSVIRSFIESDSDRRFIFVVGGGGPARIWQNAFREIAAGGVKNNDADWIGIMATRLNAQLIKAIMCEWCALEVVKNPN
jgi:uridylate kinase